MSRLRAACNTPNNTPSEQGVVLLAVVWLIAALALLTLGVSDRVMDRQRLWLYQQQMVHVQVALENSWQCQWWQWRHHTALFPQPHANCPAIERTRVQWATAPSPCADSPAWVCRDAWVTLQYTQDDYCRQLRQSVQRRSRLSQHQEVEVVLERGARRWQFCEEPSS